MRVQVVLRPAAAGRVSKSRSAARRLSLNRRSSSALACRIVGPTRTQTRPSQRTGGYAEGAACTTATSHPSTALFSTVSDGCGMIAPSERISDSWRRNGSSITAFSQRPSFFTPTNTTPALPVPGKSLAKAQTLRRIAAPSAAVRLNSTSCDSPPRSNAASSESE